MDCLTKINKFWWNIFICKENLFIKTILNIWDYFYLFFFFFWLSGNKIFYGQLKIISKREKYLRRISICSKTSKNISEKNLRFQTINNKSHKAKTNPASFLYSQKLKEGKRDLRFIFFDGWRRQTITFFLKITRGQFFLGF